jgi:hypothetical protein
MVDFTALMMLKTKHDAPPRKYVMVGAHRWKLETAYPEIVRDMAALLREIPDAAEMTLAIDVGGAAGVDDLFRETTLPPRVRLLPVRITGGYHAEMGKRGVWNVPKRLLVGIVQIVLQTRRLKGKASLPEADALERELLHFRMTLTEASHDVYEGRRGTHDDLVLATALALWAGEHKFRRWLPVVDSPATLAHMVEDWEEDQQFKASQFLAALNPLQALEWLAGNAAIWHPIQSGGEWWRDLWRAEAPSQQTARGGQFLPAWEKPSPIPFVSGRRDLSAQFPQTTGALSRESSSTLPLPSSAPPPIPRAGVIDLGERDAREWLSGR